MSKCCQGVSFSLIKNPLWNVHCIQVWVWQKLKVCSSSKWQMHERFTYNRCLVTQTPDHFLTLQTEWFWLPFVPDQRLQGQTQMSFKFHLINIPQQCICHFQRLHMLFSKANLHWTDLGKKWGVLNKYYWVLMWLKLSNPHCWKLNIKFLKQWH